jgi:hypothetical protein
MSTNGKPNASPTHNSAITSTMEVTPEHLARVHPEDEDTAILSIFFEVTWKAAWLTEDNVKALSNGITTIHTYIQISKPPLRKKTRTTPPIPPPRSCGWHPQHTTYTTNPIKP